MIGHIDRDNEEVKKCRKRSYAMKFKSYKLGLLAGKSDSKHFKNLEKTTKCPYLIPPDVYELLKKRARWFAGYDDGYAIQHARKMKKKGKKK